MQLSLMENSKNLYMIFWIKQTQILCNWAQSLSAWEINDHLYTFLSTSLKGRYYLPWMITEEIKYDIFKSSWSIVNYQ